MKKILWLIAALLLAVLTAAAYYAYGPRKSPEGQPPLLSLRTENLQDFRQAFNDAANGPRVLLMLSPT